MTLRGVYLTSKCHTSIIKRQHSLYIMLFMTRALIILENEIIIRRKITRVY